MEMDFHVEIGKKENISMLFESKIISKIVKLDSIQVTMIT